MGRPNNDTTDSIQRHIARIDDSADGLGDPSSYVWRGRRLMRSDYLCRRQ